ncbi:MAG: hypothetical protein MK193_05515 [Lentisphaeria bacterium]|nr:hypothetical protein [Lentisphaeria bacterium]
MLKNRRGAAIVITLGFTMILFLILAGGIQYYITLRKEQSFYLEKLQKESIKIKILKSSQQ